jgi:Tol biopolymer transport system component/DNA-binding SARP family transcriptional activator
LGQVYLEREGARVGGTAVQPRRLALLAVLAAAGSRGVSRDRLFALLWTDTEEERARKGLNQALYAIRREIGSDDAIAGTRDLVLAPEFLSSDIADFRTAIAAGDLDGAAALYKGQFLDGFHLPGLAEFERWMESERTALATDHVAILERLARRAEERQDADAAVAWWRRLAGLDPLDGKRTLRLMEALVRAGDRVGALKQARIYEVLLAEELELPPDRDVLALADRIRQMEGTAVEQRVAAPVGGSENRLVDLTPPPPPAPIEESRTESGLGIHAVGSFTPGTPPPPAAVVPEPAGPTPREIAPAAAGRRRFTIGAWVAAVVAAVAIGAVLLNSGGARTPELGGSRKITFDAGLEVDPALAPDGRLLAYAAGPEGAMRVYVRRVDGGRAVRVSGDFGGDHRRPRWSPDGSHLVYQAGGAVWMVPALGGPSRPVIPVPAGNARAFYPEWSPDGRTLAWVQGDTIFSRRLAGGPASALGTLPSAHSLAWSPDGRWIAAVAGNAAFVYGAGAATMQVGFTNVGNLAPSSVWVVPATGGAAVQVAGGDHLNTSPEWIGPDRLVFVSDRDGARDLFLVTLGASGEPAGSPTRLTTGLGAHTVSVQRDGRAVAYSVFTQSSNVWALPIPAGGPVGTSGAVPITRGTQTVEGLDVSPDGKWLAFDADGGGSQDIYRFPLDGGDVERVVDGPTGDHRPTWSPDGRALLFYSFVDGVRRGFIVPASGGPPRPIHPTGNDEQHTPVLSPDMRRILFHRWTGKVDQLFELTRTGDSTWSEARQVTKHGGFGGRWSRDGSRLAYIASRQVRLMGSGPDAEATSRALYDASDTSAAQPNPVAIQWAPDGRVLYMKAFDDHGEAGIWALDPAGGAPRLLVRFDEPLRPARRPEFATDGRRFYFTLAQSESDVWVMTVRGW